MVIFHSYVKLPEGKMLLIGMQPRDVCSEGGRIKVFPLKEATLEKHGDGRIRTSSRFASCYVQQV